MNEKIKELYELAQITHEYGGPTEIKSLDAEKFAELIVRECANYVQFYYKDHACEMIAHDMKHHFGVEL